jgi:hypothetical protein
LREASSSAAAWNSSSAKSIGSYGFIVDSGSSGGGWQPSSSKIAVHRPRRLANPSKYKLSPYMVPKSKIRVSREEADLYECVVEMGLNKENWK